MKELDTKEIKENESGEIEIIREGQEGEKEIITTKKGRKELVLDALGDKDTYFTEYESRFSEEEQNKIKDKKENNHPHFVDVNYPKKEPWRTDIYFGQRDGYSAHAHIALSGAAILYLRDEQGKEIILDGKIINNESI